MYLTDVFYSQSIPLCVIFTPTHLPPHAVNVYSLIILIFSPFFNEVFTFVNLVGMCTGGPPKYISGGRMFVLPVIQKVQRYILYCTPCKL